MMRLCLFLLALMLPSSAFAQTVEVRSGAHASFTRLVLHMPRRLAFDLDRAGQSVEVSFGKERFDFRTDSIFDRIGRERLASVAPQPNGIRFELTCDCEVSATWAGTAMLTLDIVGPATRSESHAPRTGPPSQVFQMPLRPSIARLPRSAVELLTEGLLPNGSQAETKEIPNGQLSASGSDARQTDLSGVEAALLRDVARASGQNLLSFKSERPVSEPGGAPEAATIAPDPSNFAVQDGLSNYTSGFATDFLQDKNHSARQKPDGAQCPKEQLYDVPSWGNALPFANQVATLRQSLSREFDNVDSEISLKLARLYVYFGFGAEAQQVLRMHPLNGLEGRVVIELAQIMDSDTIAQDGFLAGHLGCEGALSLWSTLAQSRLQPGLALDRDAILRALGALPRHLMEHVGPILSRKLLEAGYDEIADGVLRRLEKTPVPASDDERLARAEMNGDAAGDDLETISAGNSEAAARALLRRIDGRLDTGGGVPEQMADLAGSYAAQLRGEPIAKELRRAYVAAIAASGDFERAFHEFDRLAPDMDAGNSIQTREVLLRLLTRDADDLGFVAKAVEYTAVDLLEIDAEVVRNAASRLSSLGFHDVAYRFVEARTPGEQGRAHRLMQAQIALDLGRPRHAEVTLLGLDGDDVNELRARARELAGDLDAAHSLFASSGQVADARRTAIATEDWVRLAQHASGEVADLARELIADDESNTQAPSIAGSLALLDASGQSRASIGALLEAHPALTE